MKVRQTLVRPAVPGLDRPVPSDGNAPATAVATPLSLPLKPLAILVALVALALTLIAPAPAHAITRSEVISRASGWVRVRVPYSQGGYYGGYRRDCSGMVSMSWKLGTSLSSRTISSVARRISISSLKPGDAILTPGHVEIFAGWVGGRRSGRYISLEQSNRATGAVRRIKSLRGRAVALRYRRISDDPVAVALAVAPTPPPAETPTPVAPLPVTDPPAVTDATSTPTGPQVASAQ